MEFILGIITKLGITNAILITVLPTAFVYVMKLIPNEKIYNVVRAFFHGIGIIISKTMCAIPIIGTIWNKVIEGYVIDLFQNTILAMVDGIVSGLKKDNSILDNKIKR